MSQEETAAAPTPPIPLSQTRKSSTDEAEYDDGYDAAEEQATYGFHPAQLEKLGQRAADYLDAVFASGEHDTRVGAVKSYLKDRAKQVKVAFEKHIDDDKKRMEQIRSEQRVYDKIQSFADLKPTTGSPIPPSKLFP